MMKAISAPDIIDPAKFRNPEFTAKGERRATVTLRKLSTLWFNTGTLCNLTCVNCYIESSPTNDRLAYLNAAEVVSYLDEVETGNWGTVEIGFTGGEPFMNPEIIAMLEETLGRGYRALVLSNAMRPMMKRRKALLALKDKYGQRLVIRVSIDHYSQTLHETERGPRSWTPALDGLKWLSDHGFHINVAGRTMWGEPEEKLRAGYGRLFAHQGIRIDPENRLTLVLFPEMDDEVDVPEISVACWDILGVDPNDVMCASSRMVVKPKETQQPVVVACTLIPYDPEFILGRTLADSRTTVALNHPHCAKFCVLGGGSCSA